MNSEAETETPAPRGTFGHVWPCPLFYTGNWRRIENRHIPTVACEGPAECYASDSEGAVPEGPTDEQVRAGREAGKSAHEVLFGNVGPSDGAWGAIVRAILSAAGGVR